MASIGKAMTPFLAAAAVVALVMAATLWTPPERAISPVSAQTSTVTPTPTPPAKTPVAEALQPLGNKLVRVFHFDNATKNWLWYDPEVPGYGGLTEMETGKPYWIKVTETVRQVQLNGRPRDLTCKADGNCWNLEGW